MTYSKVSVNEIVAVKIFIVVTERVEQRLCHFDPTDNAEKLYYGEERKVQVGTHVVQLLKDGKGQGSVGKVPMCRVAGLVDDRLQWSLQELAGKQGHREVGRGYQGRNLERGTIMIVC